jgi:hypothetical protein
MLGGQHYINRSTNAHAQNLWHHVSLPCKRALCALQFSVMSQKSQRPTMPSLSLANTTTNYCYRFAHAARTTRYTLTSRHHARAPALRRIIPWVSNAHLATYPTWHTTRKPPSSLVQPRTGPLRNIPGRHHVRTPLHMYRCSNSSCYLSFTSANLPNFRLPFPLLFPPENLPHFRNRARLCCILAACSLLSYALEPSRLLLTFILTRRALVITRSP